MLQYFFAIILLLFSWTARSGEKKITLHEVNQLNNELLKLDQFHEGGVPYVLRVPYVPPTWDYGFELGYYSTLQNNYWTGFNVGRHLGTCIFTSSQTCQQFLDGIIGVGGRESRTHFLATPSLRWQFVNFPAYWAGMARVFAGGSSSIEPEGPARRFVYGAGFGVTTYLHPRADLRFEARFGQQGDYPFGQVFLSFQFKMDKWVEYFGERLKALGVGAIETTGDVIKGTVNTTGDVISGTGNVLKKTAETTGNVIGTTVKTTGKILETAADGVGDVTTIRRSKKQPAPSPSPTPNPEASPMPIASPAP